MHGISDLLDSDMEDSHNFLDENSLLSSASDENNPTGNKPAPAKKSRKRKCVTMPKAKARVVKTSPAPSVLKGSRKLTEAKQKALEEHVKANTVGEGQDNQMVDETMLETEDKPKSKPKPKPKVRGTGKKTAKAALADAADSEDRIEVENTPMFAHSSHAANQTKSTAPKVIKTAKVPVKPRVQLDAIQESQPEPMDVDGEGDELRSATYKHQQPMRARTESRTRQEPSHRRRAGSVSDTERGDPNLRRRLGDVTRKFENIDAKYRNLKEVGITEANLNVEKLRRQCEATAEASNNLVSSLKKELAISAPLAQDARRMKQQLQVQNADLSQLKSSNEELTSSLASAQNEIKALQAKLAAARKASIEPPASVISKTPKGHTAPRVPTSSTNESVQLAQMKLDLYSDLTGLIIRSVKRAEDGDTYDCIQTGRNGTLHFKLFIDAEDAKSASFEETEFLYTPLLDANRDREMIELMPPYLTEDITFARQNAAKFYQRVVDTLTRRVGDA